MENSLRWGRVRTGWARVTGEVRALGLGHPGGGVQAVPGVL